MNKVSLSLLASALAAPAFAGSIESAPFDPAPSSPAPIVAAEPILSFAGAYAGGSLGYGDLDADGAQFALFGFEDTDVDNDGDVDFSFSDGSWHYGLHAGYGFERGAVVFGPEIALFGGGAQLGGETNFDDGLPEDRVDADVNFGARLVLRGGYAFGQNLVYGLLGATYLDISVSTSGIFFGDSGDDFEDWGYAAGFGYERLLTERVSLGVQYTLDKVDDLDFGEDAFGEVDIERRTLELRLSARF